MKMLLTAIQRVLPMAVAAATIVSGDHAIAADWGYSCSQDALTQKDTCLVLYEGGGPHAVAFVGAMQMGIVSLNIQHPEGVKYRTPSGQVETAACDQVHGQSCHIQNMLAIGGLVDALAVSETNDGGDVLIRVFGIGGETDDMYVQPHGFVEAMENNHQLALAALQYRKFAEERNKIVDEQMKLLLRK